ncbi:hypothetical protein Tco_1498214 [Tanacetum coccineum]
MKAIYNIDVPMDSQAPKTSSPAEKVPQGKKPRAKRATSEEGAHPQLSSGMSAFTLIKPVYLASFTFTLSLHQEGIDEGTQNYSLNYKLAGNNPSVLVDKTKSAGDGLKTAHTDSDESEEEETKKDEDTHTSHDVPKDTSVAELKNIQWELPAEFLDLPSQVSSVQGKLKTLDSLPSLLNTVTDTLNRFATMVETASRAVSKNVPSASQATTLPAEGGRTPIQVQRMLN